MIEWKEKPVQVPTVIGILVCEKSLIEQGSGNVTLVNCFTIQKVQRLPSEQRQFTVFASLIDGEGTITLDLVINRIEGDIEIYRKSRPLAFSDRLQEVRFIYHVTTCS